MKRDDSILRGFPPTGALSLIFGLALAGCADPSADTTPLGNGADAAFTPPPVVGADAGIPVGPSGDGGSATGGTGGGTGGSGSTGGAGGGGGRGPYCREGIEDVCGDNYDNNCDGQVDEGCNCTSSEKPCYTGDPLDLEVPNGQCRQGTQACELEFYGACTGEVLPSEEVCDGIDNDCDGLVDELDNCNNAPPVAVCPPDQTGPTLANYNFHGTYSDPDGDAMESATWTIAERPAGSTSAPVPPDMLDTVVFADLQGSYTLELTVKDARGGVGKCQTHLTTNSNDQLRVEMVWNVGAQEDGSDVDLHLKRAPDAAWFDSASTGDDCFYENCRVCDVGYEVGDAQVEALCREEIASTPDPMAVLEWSAPLGDDDPRLDLDDVEGGGPENINIRAPRNGTYRLGVHYFDDDGFGNSTVSLRIYCAGRLAGELGPTVLFGDINSPGGGETDFWEAADIVWSGGDCQVTALGTRGCERICTRDEAEFAGGCPENSLRGSPCR